MDPLTDAFNERLQEIETYLDLLDALERQARTGPPKIGGTTITADQQKILYSSVYLQLYNLVEATVTWCIEAVVEATAGHSRWKPGDLCDALKKEWVRATARTHIPLNVDKRLDSAIQFCDYLIGGGALQKWAFEFGGGGNWDTTEIESISRRIGCRLNVPQPILKDAKRKLRDDKNSLELVKDFRNRLAHGSISFRECGDGVTVVDLRDVKDRTVKYLREVLSSFRTYIDTHEFLVPASRPAVPLVP